MRRKSIRRSCVVLGAVLALVAVPGPDGPAAAADDALSTAAGAAAAGRWEAALAELRRQFEAGYATPGDVYADPRFAVLRETAEARGPWRELMREFPRQSRLTMVPPDEPGVPMLIRGRVVRSPDGAPIAGAQLELYHTDAGGNYEPGRRVGDGSNPRLFCIVRTDEQGRFEVRTIQAAPYPGASPGAAHVHFIIEAAGYRRYGDEFRPYTHPREPAERESGVLRGRPTSEVREQDGLLVCEATIPMRP